MQLNPVMDTHSYVELPRHLWCSWNRKDQVREPKCSKMRTAKILLKPELIFFFLHYVALQNTGKIYVNRNLETWEVSRLTQTRVKNQQEQWGVRLRLGHNLDATLEHRKKTDKTSLSGRWRKTEIEFGWRKIKRNSRA